MGGPASSITKEIFIEAYEQTALPIALNPSKVLERFVE